MMEYTYKALIQTKKILFLGHKSNSNTGMAVVPDSNRISFYIYSANNFSNRIFAWIQFL